MQFFFNFSFKCMMMVSFFFKLFGVCYMFASYIKQPGVISASSKLFLNHV